MDAEARRLRARLVFSDTGSPLHHVHVQAVFHHFLLPDEPVASGWTGADGVLDVPLGAQGAGAHALELRLEVRDAAPGDDPIPDDRRNAWPAVTCRADLRDGTFDAGTVRVAFWPYRDDWPVPRARGADGEHEEEGCAEVRRQLFEQKVRFAATLAEHVAKCVIPGRPRLAEIQEDYPPSLTQQVEAEQPGRTRGDAWLAERVLNGHHPLLLGRDRSDPGLLRWKLDWGDVLPDGTYDLTDVDASFELRDGLPLPVRIALRIRRPRGGGWDVGAVRQVRPGDPDWDAAKRVFRVQYLLSGEIDAHMTMSHIRVEQYGVAVRRNLRRNPIRHILAPHLREVVATNVQADLVAWGPVSATVRGSTFDTAQIKERMRRSAGREDWLSWRPREPLSERHTFARGGRLFWEVLGGHVDEHIAKHREEIEEQWVEIHRLSDDLVRGSAPHLPTADDPDIMLDDDSELPDDDAEREVVEGVRRALRPVTASDSPGDGDMERLAQLCRYVIFHATWWHSWIHDRQYDDGGEIRYASLALRNGSLGSEDDDEIGPAPVGATLGLGTIAIGCAVRHGYLVANEDGDVPAGLRERLLARRADFLELGVDVEQIRARINI